jgi:hypothetical protein
MVPQHWSVNGLATELGVDRRTIARRLHAVKPAGNGPHGPLYLMGEVYRELTGWCSECSERERGDRWARGFLARISSDQAADELAQRLLEADDPVVRRRVVREWLASALWAFVRARRDPPCPDWRALTDRAFARAWRGLTKHPAATLAEVSEIADDSGTRIALEAERLPGARVPG